MPSPPLLIAGATGALGQAFRRVCRIRGLLDRAALDIAEAKAIDQVLLAYAPAAASPSQRQMTCIFPPPTCPIW